MEILSFQERFNQWDRKGLIRVPREYIRFTQDIGFDVGAHNRVGQKILVHNMVLHIVDNDLPADCFICTYSYPMKYWHIARIKIPRKWKHFKYCVRSTARIWKGFFGG